MKKLIGLAGIIALIGASAVVTVSTTGCSSTGTGTNSTVQTLDTNAVIAGIKAVVPIGVRLACEKDTNAAAYFDQAALIIGAAANNGTFDMQTLTNSLATISVRELRSQDAILAEEAGLAIYQAFAAQVVTAKLDQVTWLRPVLSALADAIKEGTP